MGDGVRYRIENRVEPMNHIVIPEAQHAEPLSAQPLVAADIMA